MSNIGVSIETETVTIRRLRPAFKDQWLTNREVFSKEVLLGIEADPDEWFIATQEEYEQARANSDA